MAASIARGDCGDRLSDVFELLRQESPLSRRVFAKPWRFVRGLRCLHPRQEYELGRPPQHGAPVQTRVHRHDSLPMTSRKPAVLAGILLFQEEAGPLDPPFWRHICGTLFGLRSTIIYLAILFEKVRNRQCLCGFSACLRGIAKSYGAVERTRTSTVLLPPAPQAGASASSATTAQWVGIILAIEC